MNICLFGASGRVGSVILGNALSESDYVRALVRDVNRFTFRHPNLEIIEGDAINENAIAEAMSNADAVISSLNTNGDSTLSDSMPLIINQMKKNGVRRIITIGTAGILQARVNPNIYRFQSSESRRKTTKDAEEHLKAFYQLKDSGLDWTIVCPTYLPTGERIGRYRFEKNFLPVNPSSISVYDTGDFAYSLLKSKQYIGIRVGLTY